MSHRRHVFCLLAPLAAVLLLACSKNPSSRSTSGGSRTDIDLTLTNLSVTPAVADAEDALTLQGTIRNVGSEMANPIPGDSFTVRFNLSRDGTFEISEAGFLEARITDPLPAGGSLNFSFTGRLKDGDTLSHFGNFCTGLEDIECVSPEQGVLGAKVDGGNAIAEISESNNYKFIRIDVIGTRIAATFEGCNAGTVGGDVGDPGCDLAFSDGIDHVNAQHRPCATGCLSHESLFPNEIHRTIRISLTLRGCAGGTCGGSWSVTTTKEKLGQVVSYTHDLNCSIFSGDTGGCVWNWDIIDDIIACTGDC